jgi:hypothetical protein
MVGSYACHAAAMLASYLWLRLQQTRLSFISDAVYADKSGTRTLEISIDPLAETENSKGFQKGSLPHRIQNNITGSLIRYETVDYPTHNHQVFYWYISELVKKALIGPDHLLRQSHESHHTQLCAALDERQDYYILQASPCLVTRRTGEVARISIEKSAG